MEGHDALERFEQSEQMAEAREHFGRRVAVLVAVMAAMLAVATLSASQSTENTILDQAKATDAYNELEANSLKKHINGNDAALLRTLGAGNPRAARGAAALDAATARKYAPNEKQLLVKARGFEERRDRSEEHHRGFQLAEGAFQLAIVLASVSIVARAVAMALLSAGVGVAGMLLLLDGFVLAVKLHQEGLAKLARPVVVRDCERSRMGRTSDLDGRYPNASRTRAA